MTNIVRNIAIASLFALLALIPTEVKAETTSISAFDTEQNAINVTISESTIHVKNAEHKILEIFSLTGEKVYTTRIDSSSENIEADNLSKGCYIVRIGKYTRKIYIR